MFDKKHPYLELDFDKKHLYLELDEEEGIWAPFEKKRDQLLAQIEKLVNEFEIPKC